MTEAERLVRRICYSDRVASALACGAWFRLYARDVRRAVAVGESAAVFALDSRSAAAPLTAPRATRR